MNISPRIDTILPIMVILILVCLVANLSYPGKVAQPTGHVGGPAEGIATRLISNKWQFVRSSGAFAEGYSYQFLANGTFRWNVIADYNGTGNGLWNYKKLSEDAGLLFLLWQNAGPAVGSNLETHGYVLYFRFIGKGKLSLAGDVLESVELSVDNKELKRAKLPDIIKENVFLNYFRIVSHSWGKSDTKDNDFIPDSYLLRADGTFVARYRNGSCQHEGRWSLTERLLLEVEKSICDLRGNQGALAWGQRYHLEGDVLILNGKYRYQRRN